VWISWCAPSRVRGSSSPRLRLILAGEGPLRPQIEGLVQDLGIQAYTRIVGAQPEDELKHLFGASDLYVSASQSDGSSISLLQAMACGLPAVVSDLPANREWVEHGENGWLFPPDDEGGLGDCLVRCAALDAATCRQMGLRNRKTVERKADWPRNVRRLVAFYRTVSAGHRARRPTKQREDSP
jgi:glycosyltransferase involved in cell wall biosynthesis